MKQILSLQEEGGSRKTGKGCPLQDDIIVTFLMLEIAGSQALETFPVLILA